MSPGSNQTIRLSKSSVGSTTDRPQASLKTVFCGEEYRGWVDGDHPTIEEGSSSLFRFSFKYTGVVYH